MVTTIARKEFIELLRDGRFRWASAALVLLIALSTLSAWTNRSHAEQQRHDAEHSIQQGWLNQGDKNAHAATHYGSWAIKPKTTLGAIDPGIENYTGTAIFLESHKRNADRYRPAASGTSAQRFGSWSAAAILQVLTPLLLIIIAFPAFAGEREQGTLRQLASLGVPMRQIAAGKSLGLVGGLALVIVPVTLLGAVTLEPQRVLSLSAIYLIYFAIVLAIVLAVSARAPSSRTALMILLGLWAVATLVVPRAASDVARALYPAPSSVAFADSIANDLQNQSDGHSIGGGDSRAAALAVLEGEAATTAAYNYRYARLFDTYAAQNRVHTMASLLSPMMAVRALSMAIAGTDVAQHRKFVDSAEVYRINMIDALNKANVESADAWEPINSDSLWASIPPFTYSAVSLADAVGSYQLAFYALVGWFSVAMLLMWPLTKVRVS